MAHAELSRRHDGRIVQPTEPVEPIPQPPRDPLAQRSRMAGAGVLVVLLAVSGFAVWSSSATAGAASKAAAASHISDDYVSAGAALRAEESLELKYRMEPGPAPRAQFDAAAASFADALGHIRTHGIAHDLSLVDSVLIEHTAYLRSTSRLFAAVDRHDAAAVHRIDADIESIYAAIHEAVFDEAMAHHDASLQEVAHLQQLDRRVSQLTPAVFLVGLLFVGLLAMTIRGYHRALVLERARAVHDSLHDALTGLPNRALLADRFEQALRSAKRYCSTPGLLLINLDRFREINDTYGHHYGDELLTQIGPRLRTVLRESDSVARLGGDEFAVLLPDVADLDATIAVAAKLRRAMETSFLVDGVDLDVEASVGAVLSGKHGDDAKTLLRRADVAMHVAKVQNLGISAYDPAADDHSPGRLALLGELRRALERGELVLHYQPKISISTGVVVGAEALVRWQHPTRGLVFPDAFVPAAEHTGLIGPLTSYVLEAAVSQARIWAAAGRALPVSVNLSARNLLDERLPDEVAARLASHGLRASLLDLEVTESAIMTEPARACRVLERLAALGVGLSIDDFGAGYTSLGQLKTLPVTELKIDRSFVMPMMEDISSALIVHSVVDLGHNLGLTIVAEGVETAQALSVLTTYGCDIAQGYHIARPMAVEAFDLWFREHPSGFPQAELVG
jgi:diguanylate cyclase